MQELFTFLSFRRSFSMSCALFSMPDDIVEKHFHCIENNAHGIEKLLLKIKVSEKFLHSEVSIIIQYRLDEYDDHTVKF